MTVLLLYRKDTEVLLSHEQPINAEEFASRLQKDNIPIVMKDKGRYYFYTLQENYFKEYTAETLTHIKKQNKLTLDIGLFSALLILLIACFNYINLNFSRLQQQVKMIYVQRLVGASRIDINKQLFFDIFFTVLIGFILSLLIMFDLIPVFNSIFSGQMKASFFFSGQVLPLLIGLILSVIPAIYVSRKITSISRQHYLDLTGGRKKQGIISILSFIQFTISIALIIATITVNGQIGLIRHGGEAYRGLIEIHNMTVDNSKMKPFVEELRTYLELGEINTAVLPLLYSGIRQVDIPNPNGDEISLSLLFFVGDTNYLSTLHIELLQGMQPKEAVEHYSRPVYINERFAEVLIGKDENPIGQPLKSYDKNDLDHENKQDGSKENPISTIVGIVNNFFINSLEEKIPPAVIHIENEANSPNTVVYFRLDDQHPERLSKVKQIWEKHNPGILLPYRNVYEHFIARNHKVFGLVELLLMYSLISIILTCFGLFGMVLYSTEQRTKEIGIRKVNGATIWQIVELLNKRFIIWIGIVFLIAAPVSWIFLTRWLQNFVYRTDISMEVFLVALLSVATIALLTVSWHSFKAASANPVKALRDE